jgi:hypothetical protein
VVEADRQLRIPKRPTPGPAPRLRVIAADIRVQTAASRVRRAQQESPTMRQSASTTPRPPTGVEPAAIDDYRYMDGIVDLDPLDVLVNAWSREGNLFKPLLTI